MDYSFLQCGEGALTVHLGDGIDPAINRRVTALQGAIGSAGLRGITDLIPAYADLTVCYDCTVISAKALQRQLRRLLDSLSVAGQDRRRVFQLPVCYGGDYGPDLDFVCHHSGLSAQEVIELHSAPDYLIYMLGFFLGIIYLNVASTRYVVDVGIWSEWFRSQYLGYDLKSFDYMWYIAQIRLLPAGGLAILGGTKFRKIAAYLFLLWAGLASGMILTSALLMLGVKGLILCIISMLPHFLCYIPAYAMLLLYLFRYPVSEWNSTKTLSFVLFLTMGIALECLVNPVLLKMFLRTL